MSDKNQNESEQTADRVRELLSRHGEGVLSTKRAGTPYGSLVHYTLDADMRPVLLLSDLAIHTQNLENCRSASLLVAEWSASPELNAPRATVLGRVEPVDETDDLRQRFLKDHPQARAYIDFADFGFYRLEIETIRHVAGFGDMGWIDAEAYLHIQ